MTEKRFYNDSKYVMQNGEVYVACVGEHNADVVATALNELLAENKQLKQFKENVIEWVDSQMKFNVKKYIETEHDHFKCENIDLHNFKVEMGID